jgi:hypothetical protein
MKFLTWFNKDNIYQIFNSNIRFYIIFFAILFEIIYINLYFINLYYLDEFDLITNILNNKVTITDLFTVHNEHIIFFLKLIFYLLIYISNYNTVYNIYLSMVILILYYLFLLKILETSKKGLFIPFLLFLYLFHPSQYEISLFPSGLGCILSYIFSIISLYNFYLYIQFQQDKNNILYYFFSYFYALVASYSQAYGFTVFITIMVFWPIIARKSILKNYLYYLWIICSIIIFYLFILQLSLLPNRPNISSIFENINSIILFLFLLLGNYLFPHKLAIIFGFIVFILSLLIIIDFLIQYLKENIFYILVIINFILVSLLISVSRYNLSLKSATAPRYIIFSMTVLIFSILYLKTKKLNILNYIKKINVKYINIFFITLLIYSFCYSLLSSFIYYELRKKYQFEQETFETQPNVLLSIMYPSKELKNLLTILKNKSLYLFKENKYNKNITYKYKYININSLKDNIIEMQKIDYIKFNNSKFIFITGYIYDESYFNNIDQLYININNKNYKTFYGNYGIKDRLIKFRKIFFRAIPIELINNGKYSITIQTIDFKNKILYEIDPNINIDLDNEQIAIQEHYIK